MLLYPLCKFIVCELLASLRYKQTKLSSFPHRLLDQVLEQFCSAEIKESFSLSYLLWDIRWLGRGERHGRENKCENISPRRHFDVLCLGECKFPLEVKVCIDYCVKCSPVRPERSCMSNFATEQYQHNTVWQSDSGIVSRIQSLQLSL